MKARIQHNIQTSLAKHQKQAINRFLANPNGRQLSGGTPIVAESRRMVRKATVKTISVEVTQPFAEDFPQSSLKHQKLVIDQFLANPIGRQLNGGAPIVAEARRAGRKERVVTIATSGSLHGAGQFIQPSAKPQEL